MKSKELISIVKNDEFRGSSWPFVIGNKPPGKNQIKLLSKYSIPIDIDPKIRNLIIHLNESGIKTLGSCAGHRKGKKDGFITLEGDKEKIKIIVKKYIDKFKIQKFGTKDSYVIKFKSLGNFLNKSKLKFYRKKYGKNSDFFKEYIKHENIE